MIFGKYNSGVKTQNTSAQKTSSLNDKIKKISNGFDQANAGMNALNTFRNPNTTGGERIKAVANAIMSATK